MSFTLEQLALLTNEQIDKEVALIEGIHCPEIMNPKEKSSHVSLLNNSYSPTTETITANKIINRENIIVKKTKDNQYYIPVFEDKNKSYGLLYSSSYLRTAMLYYLAKKFGIIREQ